MNAHHTLELELNHQFTLTKPLWDGQHCERLDEACKPGRDVRPTARLCWPPVSMCVPIILAGGCCCGSAGLWQCAAVLSVGAHDANAVLRLHTGAKEAAGRIRT